MAFLQTSNGIAMGAAIRAWAIGMACAVCWTSSAAGIALIPDTAPALGFGADWAVITFRVRNDSTQTTVVDLRHRLFQASSATIMPVRGVESWKKITLPGEQTAVEEFKVLIPQVSVATSFYLVWFDGEKQIGRTPIRAFPNQLLASIRTLAGETPLGLYDPDGILKAGLKDLPHTDLVNVEDIADCESKVIIVVARAIGADDQEIIDAVKRKAGEGGRMVVLRSAARDSQIGPPTVVAVAEGDGRIILADPSLVEGLISSPAAQLTLMRMVELATEDRNQILFSDSSR